MSEVQIWKYLYGKIKLYGIKLYGCMVKLSCSGTGESGKQSAK